MTEVYEVEIRSLKEDCDCALIKKTTLEAILKVNEISENDKESMIEDYLDDDDTNDFFYDLISALKYAVDIISERDDYISFEMKKDELFLFRNIDVKANRLVQKASHFDFEKINKEFCLDK